MPLKQQYSHYRVKFIDDSQAPEVDYNTPPEVNSTEKVASYKYEGPRFPNLHMMFNHKQKVAAEEEDRVVYRSVETTVKKCEDKVVEKTHIYEKEENVDMEAGEYIKRRHQLNLQKLMSINAA